MKLITKDLKVDYIYQLRDKDYKHIMHLTDFQTGTMRGNLLATNGSEEDYPKKQWDDYFSFGTDVISLVAFGSSGFDNAKYEFQEIGPIEDHPEYRL